MARALVLIDIQMDYFPGGAMELVGMEEAADNARRLLDRFRDEQARLFHIQHLSVRPGSTFFVPETEGVKINPGVAPRDDEIVIEKHYPNSFRETVLLDHLRGGGIDSLVFCGAMSHMCVDATVRAAFDFGFDCTVAADACATRDLPFGDRVIRAGDVHGAFMSALSVPCARVIDTDQILSGG